MKIPKIFISFFKWLMTFSIGLGLIAGAVILAAFLILMRPSIEKSPPEEKVTFVKTIVVSPSDEQVVITAFGAIQGIRKLTLHPEVSGKVIERAEQLTEGGLIQAGEVLLQIDPRDYETQVTQERAAVAKAEFELKQERGRGLIAEQEWELLNPEIKSSELGQELALRKPHLIEKQTALVAAKSRLEKALLDLERTKIVSPFDAIVVEKLSEEGQLITPQTPLAKLVATDTFEVQVSIPYEKLSWLPIHDIKELQKTHVAVMQDLGRGKKIEKTGHILRLLGDVDPSGRMARVLVAIDDPLGRKDLTLRQTPFLIGTYVQVSIHGPILQNIFILPRLALREAQKVWIKSKAGTLDIQEVEVLWKTEENVVIGKGLYEGDEIIISALPIAIAGMKVKTETGEDQ